MINATKSYEELFNKLDELKEVVKKRIPEYLAILKTEKARYYDPFGEYEYGESYNARNSERIAERLDCVTVDLKKDRIIILVCEDYEEISLTLPLDVALQSDSGYSKLLRTLKEKIEKSNKLLK